MICSMLTMKAIQESTARILEAIKQIDSPCTAAADVWDVRITKDWSGDDAVYVSVTFRDDQIRAIWPFRREFEQAIKDIVQDEMGRELWLVYVDFHAHDVGLDPDPEYTKRRMREVRKHRFA